MCAAGSEGRGPEAVALRPPDVVMRLQRMGAAHQTRLSFLRALLRRAVREKWKSVADWRLEMFPARSTRMKKNGTPRASARCRVDSLWQTVSNPTPKRRPNFSMS